MEIHVDSLFRMLSDNTRLRVLMLLQQEGELCVCELTYTLELSQPKISRHLAQLRDSEVVLTRRVGQWMYYRINDALPKWIHEVLQSTLDGTKKLKPFSDDYKMLKSMPNRPGAECCA